MKRLFIAFSLCLAMAVTASAGLIKNMSDLENIQDFSPSSITKYVLPTNATTIQNWATSGYTKAAIYCYQTLSPGTAAAVKFGLNSSVTNYVPGTSFGPHTISRNSNGTYNTTRISFSRISTSSVNTTGAAGITCSVVKMN